MPQKIVHLSDTDAVTADSITRVTLVQSANKDQPTYAVRVLSCGTFLYTDTVTDREEAQERYEEILTLIGDDVDNPPFIGYGEFYAPK